MLAQLLVYMQGKNEESETSCHLQRTFLRAVCMNKDVTIPSWTESAPQAGSHHAWQQRQHSAFLGQKNSRGFKTHLVELSNCCSEAVGPRVAAPLLLCLISCDLIDFLPSYYFPSQRRRCRQKRSVVALQRCRWEEHITYGTLIGGVWEKSIYFAWTVGLRLWESLMLKQFLRSTRPWWLKGPQRLGQY